MALIALERQIWASVIGFALVNVNVKGLETNITQKDRQWILKIYFLCTLCMLSVSLQTSEGWVPNKAGSMDHRYGRNIQGGSIAISGWSKFAAVFTPLSVDCHRWVFKMTGRRKTIHEDISKKRGHWVIIQRDMNILATSEKQGHAVKKNSFSRGKS